MYSMWSLELVYSFQSDFNLDFDRCVRYDNLPQPYCFLENDPDNPCCQRPKCVFPVNYITNVGEITTPLPKTGNSYWW